MEDVNLVNLFHYNITQNDITPKDISYLKFKAFLCCTIFIFIAFFNRPSE